MKFNIFCQIPKGNTYAKVHSFYLKTFPEEKKPEHVRGTDAFYEKTSDIDFGYNITYMYQFSMISLKNSSDFVLSGTVTMRSNQTWNIWQSWARNEQWKFNVLEFSFEHINQCGKKTENEKRNWRKSAIPKDFSIGLVRWLQVSSELPSACIYSHRYWKMVFLQATGFTHVSAIFREKDSLAEWLILVWHLELHYAYTQPSARSINCHTKRTLCWHFAYVLYIRVYVLVVVVDTHNIVMSSYKFTDIHLYQNVKILILLYTSFYFARLSVLQRAWIRRKKANFLRHIKCKLAHRESLPRK